MASKWLHASSHTFLVELLTQMFSSSLYWQKAASGWSAQALLLVKDKQSLQPIYCQSCTTQWKALFDRVGFIPREINSSAMGSRTTWKRFFRGIRSCWLLWRAKIFCRLLCMKMSEVRNCNADSNSAEMFWMNVFDYGLGVGGSASLVWFSA